MLNNIRLSQWLFTVMGLILFAMVTLLATTDRPTTLVDATITITDTPAVLILNSAVDLAAPEVAATLASYQFGNDIPLLSTINNDCDIGMPAWPTFYAANARILRKNVSASRLKDILAGEILKNISDALIDPRLNVHRWSLPIRA